jgi:uncharacterized OB-fold protein
MPLFPVRRDAASADFFDGTARGEFLVVRDRASGRFLDPKTDITIDPNRLERVPAAGTGTIVSWSVVHGRDADGSPTRAVVGIVELTEGPWWWTELRADPDADLYGAPARVEFVSSGDGERDEVVPVFFVG